MRVDAGAVAAVPYRDGSGRVGYVHVLSPEAVVPWKADDAFLGPAVVTVSVAARDAVYRDFLGMLALDREHREDLAIRGLSADRIAARGYRSVPRLEMPWAHAARLLDAGRNLEGVPGFYRAPRRSGGSYWTFLNPAGYFIPIEDAAGRIQALQIRRHRPLDGGGKYMMFSSGGRPCGANAHTPAHVARPAVLLDRRVWITEGPLKAEVATDRLGAVVIGTIGVDGWPQAIPVLERLGTPCVVLANDADEAGRKANRRIWEVFASRGWAVTVASWDSGVKGIDDALLAGKEIQVS
jgi:hypothetical protein